MKVFEKHQLLPFGTGLDNNTRSKHLQQVLPLSEVEASWDASVHDHK